MDLTQEPFVTQEGDKGKQGGTCERTTCGAGPAIYFNHSTKAWYCITCAFDIQEFENSMPEPVKIFDEFYKPRNKK